MIQRNTDYPPKEEPVEKPKRGRLTWKHIIQSFGDKALDKLSGTQIFILLAVLGTIALVGMFFNWKGSP